MNMKFYYIYAIAFALTINACGERAQSQNQVEELSSIQDKARIELIKSDDKVDVMVDGKLFTSLSWPEGVYKPVLYPINNAAGTEITRGFPLKPRAGERADHRHHVGNWLNYGNVNGFDFWGNGHTGERSPNGGEIKFKGIEKLESGNEEGLMITNASWLDPEENELLTEKTEYHFIADNNNRIIDRIVTLTASVETVHFDDTKEGMFGIRVARQLELPSDGNMTLIDAEGNISKVKGVNDGVTGDYISSAGEKGLSVWGTRAKWMNLFGSIGDEKISVVMEGHPKNINHPTYWHARGYGLFAANPLGVRDFTKKEQELNFKLTKGESITFRYRIIISAGKHLSKKDCNKYFDDFASKY